MIRGFYSAASALETAMQNQDVVAHNIAHATVPGYRRRVLTFESFDGALAQASSGPPAGNLGGTRTAGSYSAFDQGDLQHTGSPLDVAIKGDGFFVLEGPKGPLYTRNGVFEMNGEGELRNLNGLAVTGQGGKITIPQGTRQIVIGGDGTVLADNVSVGKLQLVRFDNPSALIPAGTTLFQAPAAANQQSGAGTVHQGYREGSNVQIVNELVSMIAGMRHYEAAQRALHSLSDAIQLTTSPQGK